MPVIRSAAAHLEARSGAPGACSVNAGSLHMQRRLALHRQTCSLLEVIHGTTRVQRQLHPCSAKALALF